MNYKKTYDFMEEIKNERICKKTKIQEKNKKTKQQQKHNVVFKRKK